MSIEERYKQELTQRTDIFKHLPYLRKLAEECKEHGVYECGFRSGVSTWAFLSAQPSIVLSIDVNTCDAKEHKALASKENVKFAFRKKDSTNYTPKEKPFGLTFLDTVHEYSHLTEELHHVCEFTTKYIAIHDTDKRWERQGRTYSAIQDFLEVNKEWELHSHTDDLHGLTVLKKC